MGNPETEAAAAGGARFDDVAVLIPCFNEELTVGQVVADFRAALPGACIYVFDNNSRDATAERARAAGAQVVRSPRQGKGHVVRHMFETVEAAWYVLVDGDGTYPADAAPVLVERARAAGADMVVGTRLAEHRPHSFRRFHRAGNRLISWLIARVSGLRVGDVLSGYRVFSRDFVKSVPLSSGGFEIETEMTLQAAARGFAVQESPIRYGERPPGSQSKLSTWGDGWLIMKLMVLVLRDQRPFAFFGGLGLAALFLSLLAGAPPVVDYVEYRYVYHVPLAVLAAALFIVSVLCTGIGVLLHTIRAYHDENYALWRRLGRRVDALSKGDAGPR